MSLYRYLIVSLSLSFLLPISLPQAQANDLVLVQPALDSQVQIRVSPKRVASTIISFIFRGMEYLDAYDHGREISAATSFNGYGECYNPTEGGGRYDGTSDKPSSSVVEEGYIKDGTMHTKTNMAFWMAPGEDYKKACGSHPEVTHAVNKTILSGHRLIKDVSVGLDYVDSEGMSQRIDNVLDVKLLYKVPSVPANNTLNQMEIITGYLPKHFSYLMGFDPANNQIHPLTEGPGEQEYPVIISTQNMQHAMGIFTPKSVNPANKIPRYGRWRFHGENSEVTKWNVVYRFHGAEAVAGDFKFRAFVVFGTLNEVTKAMRKLNQAFPDPSLRYVYKPFAPITECTARNGESLYTPWYSEGEINQRDCTSGPILQFFRKAATGRALLYRCFNPNGQGDHFVSRDSNCEGFNFEGAYGYVQTKKTDYHQALQRYFKPNVGHMILLEGARVPPGYSYEGTLGYVLSVDKQFKGSFSLTTTPQGKVHVVGWACLYKVPEKLTVDILAAPLGGQRTLLGSVVANQPGSENLATSCGANGVNFRFDYEIPDAAAQDHSKEFIYVRVRSPREEWKLHSQILWPAVQFDRPSLP